MKATKEDAVKAHDDVLLLGLIVNSIKIIKQDKRKEARRALARLRRYVKISHDALPHGEEVVEREKAKTLVAYAGNGSWLRS
jgi:hypothetical protein